MMGREGKGRESIDGYNHDLFVRAILLRTSKLYLSVIVFFTLLGILIEKHQVRRPVITFQIPNDICQATRGSARQRVQRSENGFLREV